MKFFKASAKRNFLSIQLLESSNQKAFLSRPFGNLGIGISASASSLATALQKNYFYDQILFLKKSRIFIFFLVLSYGISTTLLQILSSLRFPIHQVKGVHWCSRKKAIWTFGSISPGLLKKQLLQKFLHTLHTFQQNIQGWVLLSTLVGFPGITPKSSLEQLFCRHGFIRAI